MCPLWLLAGDSTNGTPELLRCQATLKTRDVAVGEFKEEILAAVLSLPLDAPGSPEEDARVKALFEKLGAGQHSVRESAESELMRCYAPARVEQWLAKSQDPEVLERARKILKYWSDHGPVDKIAQRLSMWNHCPPCLAKLKHFEEMCDLARKQEGGCKSIHDSVSRFRMANFRAQDRLPALVFCLSPTQEPEQGAAPAEGNEDGYQQARVKADLARVLMRELADDEWKNKALLDAIGKALAEGSGQVDSSVFEVLLWGIPVDADLKGWGALLQTATSRQGAMAAVMVKTGDKAALPFFLDLLNKEWTEYNEVDGLIRGGGHSLFYSPFPDFKLLSIPAYRQFAQNIVAGIESKFSDDRVAIHNAYLNAVRPFADTDAGLALLKKLGTNACPQTALAAAAILFKQNQPQAIDVLTNALSRARGSAIANNGVDLAAVARAIRGDMFLKPESSAQLRGPLEFIGRKLAPQLLVTNQVMLLWGTESLVFSELPSCGISCIDREPLIGGLSRFNAFRSWEYPEHAVVFLVEDARRKGDVAALMDGLKARALRSDATIGDEVLFASAALHSGSISMLIPFRDTLKKRVQEAECPAQLRTAAWAAFSELILESPQPLRWVANVFLLDPARTNLEAIAGKLAQETNSPVANLFRLSYGLPGAQWDWRAENAVDEAASEFCNMAWKQAPPDSVLQSRIMEWCRIYDKEAGAAWPGEFLANASELIRRRNLQLEPGDRSNQIFVRLMAEVAFRRGDRQQLEEWTRYRVAPVYAWADQSLEVEANRQMMILELSQGIVSEKARRVALAGQYGQGACVYSGFATLLYESGFPDKAGLFRDLPDDSSAWCLDHRGLVWAWNEAMAGHGDEAVRLAEGSARTATSRQLSDYAIMLRRWLKKPSPEFKEFLAVLATRNQPGRKAVYGKNMAEFSGKAVDSDLKSLSAFLAARVAMALGKAEREIRELAQRGVEAGGLHGTYCRDILNSLPDKDKSFSVTSSWFSRDPMPADMNPFVFAMGLRYQGKPPYLLASSIEWLDPYGILGTRRGLSPFYDGAGYWMYIRGQDKAWVPGEWSIIVRHQNGTEYHQRTLLPYGRKPSEDKEMTKEAARLDSGNGRP